MKHRIHNMLSGMLCLCTTLIGCNTDAPPPPVEEAQEALSEESPDVSSAEGSGAAALESAWDIPMDKVVSVGTSELVLALKSWTKEPVHARVTIEEHALGLTRIINLAEVDVEPGASASVRVVPRELPIRPQGTGAGLIARVSYTHSGIETTTGGDSIAIVFRGDEVFVSHDDTAELRMAALGDQASLRTVEEAQQALRGIVDGVSVSATTGLKADIDGEQVLTAESYVGAEPASPVTDKGGAPVALGGLPPCFRPPLTAPQPVQAVAPICFKWRDPAYRDSLAGGAGGTEDYLYGQSVAAFASAAVYSSAGTLWSGRLDESGCTPTLTYCSNNVTLRVDTSSMQRPGYSVGTVYYFPSVAMPITIDTPANHVVAPTVYGYSDAWTGQSRVRAEITTTTPQGRVAALLSRALVMKDNGLITAPFGGFGPSGTITFDLTQGCSSSSPTYWSRYTEYAGGPFLFGEACSAQGTGTSSTIYLGRALQVVSAPTSAPWTNLPLSFYTYQSKFTLGHELGHSIQTAHGANFTGNGYWKANGSADCACDYVNTSNRLHCLQSAHSHADAFKEGFGHYYAARLMNNRSTSTCAFSYYKDTVVYNWSSTSGYTRTIAAPPYSVNCDAPWTDPGLASHTGWQRYVCPATNAGSEQDWLTFLWSVDGESYESNRTTLSDMMAIVDGAGSGTSLTWATVRAQAEAHYGPGTVKLSRFVTAAATHGVQ